MSLYSNIEFLRKILQTILIISPESSNLLIGKEGKIQDKQLPNYSL